MDFLSQRAAPYGQELAVVGFSLGAFLALDLSAADPHQIRSVVVYYGTGHWFYEPDRSDAYNQPAAALAWERTLAFLKETHT